MKVSTFRGLKNKGSLKPKNKQLEQQMQISCICWFDLKYPKYSKLLNCNLNNSPGGKSGKLNKKLGIRSGRSDLVLYYHSRAYNIELKTKEGNQSAVQKAYQSQIEAQGFSYVIISSLDEFIDYINSIIKE